MELDGLGGVLAGVMLPPRIQPTNEILRLIASFDEFKGEWRAVESIKPERLQSLRRVATIESIGSSTRIEGAKLSDREVESLLRGLQTESFRSRDEQEVAGYAYVMETIQVSWQEMPVSPLAERLVKLLVERGSLTVAGAASVTDANRNTIKDKFAELVGQGLAVLHGKGRGAHYRPAGP